jgi:ATP-binding cassette subfamily C protein
MHHTGEERGRDELKSAMRESRALFGAVALFSVFVNLLMLPGPIYMLQIYDRVLGGRSEETLLALSILAAFLFTILGILDYARGRILARIGARFQARMDRRVFAAALGITPGQAGNTGAKNGLHDLEAVQKLLSSPVLGSVFDMPWAPFFLMALFIFHPWLGYLAVSGGILLIAIAFLNQWLTRRTVLEAGLAARDAGMLSDRLAAESELVRSLGMRRTVFERWQIARNASLSAAIAASDAGGGFSVLTRTFRMLLQSAMLGLGAYLVLQGEMTGGAMIAASIILGRALAPIEQSIAQWAMVQRAFKGWHDLGALLDRTPKAPPHTELPRPAAKLKVEQLTVIPPGQHQASLQMVGFGVEPGQALGVIGQSGSGKSTLARALTGVWQPARGKIRLDGAALDQYDPDTLGTYIGYLPQRVQLFDGTIAENIARMALDPDDALVVKAARKAAAHNMILQFPDGYDTRVSSNGGRLSGGQLQRIGLARAMYGDPVILILDEPNSNLDNEGSEALNLAIRQMKADGNAVLIMAHRPAAIAECDLILMLEGGILRAFGPKDDVLKKVLQNSRDIDTSAGAGALK